MCTGTEHVHMEGLKVEAGDDHKLFGSLSNQTMGGAMRFVIKKFLRKYAESKDEDGNFLNEGQLRALWRDFVVPQCSLNGRCRGTCAALPGDTIFWRRSDHGYPTSFKYEPATQEDIIERGYLAYGPGGLLVAHARMAREDSSYLELGSDSEAEEEE